MAKLFKVEVITPYRPFFSGEVEAVVLVLPDGEKGVRADHAPFVSALRTGPLRLLGADGVWKEAALSAGSVTVTAAGALILAGAAEWPEEIDRKRAEEAKARAGAALAEPLMKYEADKYRADAERADLRLAVLARSESARR